MTSENSNESFNVDEEEEDSNPNNHFGNSFSDDENSFVLPRKFNNNEESIQHENSKKNIFSIDNILGLDNSNKKIKRNENEKYFIRPIPLIATSQEMSAFKKRERFYNNNHQSLAINLHSPNAETPTPSSVCNQNGGYLYANWIELQKSSMGHQGNFLFGYHGMLNKTKIYNFVKLIIRPIKINK